MKTDVAMETTEKNMNVISLKTISGVKKKKVSNSTPSLQMQNHIQ